MPNNSPCERQARLWLWIGVLLILITLVFNCLNFMYVTGLIHIFEDGSWAVGQAYPWWISGCLPFAGCN